MFDNVDGGGGGRLKGGCQTPQVVGGRWGGGCCGGTKSGRWPVVGRGWAGGGGGGGSLQEGCSSLQVLGERLDGWLCWARAVRLQWA